MAWDSRSLLASCLQAFRDTVKVLDTEGMSVTMRQMGKAGAKRGLK